MLAPVYLPLLLLAAVVGTGLSLFAWLHRDTAGAGPLSLFLLATSFLAITDGLSLATPGLNTVYWATLSAAITAIIPLAWLLCVLEYTGREHWITLRTAAVLLVEPVGYSLLVWSNDSHQLVWSNVNIEYVDPYTVFVATREIAFWGHMAYAYLLVSIGAVLLFRVLWQTDGLFRSQSTALLAAIAIPMSVNALYGFGTLGVAVDPTGITFVLSGAVLAVAMLRGQLLDISPAARELGREELISELENPVVIVDASSRIVDANAAAQSLLSDGTDGLVGRSLSAVQPELADAVERPGGIDEVTFEPNGVPRHYDVGVSGFHRAYGAISGHIVSLRDVTERTRREQRLDVMNRLFRHNLRNEMNVVRGNAELLEERLGADELSLRADRIITTVDEVIDRSDKIGSLSRSLEGDHVGQQVDIRRMLDSAIGQAVADGDVDMQVDADESQAHLGTNADPSIEIAIAELLENAIEHGATAITVGLDSDDEAVELVIEDDGPGIPEQELSVIEAGTETPLHHGSGIGLWMATWLVTRAGGTIAFDVDESGTTVTVRLHRAPNAD